MNTKTDEGLYEKARKLFISKASIDEFAGWELVKLFVFGVCFINKVPFVRGMRPRVGRGPVSSWSSCAPR